MGGRKEMGTGELLLFDEVPPNMINLPLGPLKSMQFKKVVNYMILLADENSKSGEK